MDYVAASKISHRQRAVCSLLYTDIMPPADITNLQLLPDELNDAPTSVPRNRARKKNKKQGDIQIENRLKVIA